MTMRTLRSLWVTHRFSPLILVLSGKVSVHNLSSSTKACKAACDMVASPGAHDTGAASSNEESKEAEERINPKHAMVGEKIIGKEDVLLDEHGVGALTPDVMPTPKGMTPAAWARHCITHLPYCCSCPWCVASRRPNMPHRCPNNADRVIPLLVAEYCFLNGQGGGDHITALVMRSYPFRVLFVNKVPAKGPEPNTVSRIAWFITTTGVSHVPIVPL